MTEQTIILFFLLVGLGITLFLYIWKAKKSIEYKNDERWQLLQNKANNVANHSNNVLIVLLFAGNMVSLFSDIQMTFTLNSVLTCILLFICLRNTIELFALKYFDKRL